MIVFQKIKSCLYIPFSNCILSIFLRYYSHISAVSVPFSKECWPFRLAGISPLCVVEVVCILYFKEPWNKRQFVHSVIQDTVWIPCTNVPMGWEEGSSKPCQGPAIWAIAAASLLCPCLSGLCIKSVLRAPEGSQAIWSWRFFYN